MESTNMPQGLEQIASRSSTSRFDPTRAVPHSVVCEILEAVRNIPSSANTQPWTVLVVQGTARDELSAKLMERFDSAEEAQAQYECLPADMISRVRDRSDCEFGGAPLQLILTAPYQQSVVEGVNGIFLDFGSLLTAILLAAHSHGLGGACLFSVAKQHEACREVLGDQLPEDQLVVCGLSLGWPEDGSDPRTQQSLPKAELLLVDQTTRWLHCDRQWLEQTESEQSGGARREHSLLELVRTRHCSHTLDQSIIVPRQLITSILNAARNVPSMGGSQPWRVTVVQGAMRDKLSARMLEEFDSGVDGSQSYKKYSTANTAQMQKGKDVYGSELYEGKHGLQRDDKVGRRTKYRPNYEFWGAPVLLLLNIPKSAVAGTYIDIGSFMYAILLAMHSLGLGGKPLGSVAKYTHICREVLGLEGMPEDEHLVCGLCIGWPTGGRDPCDVPDFFPTRLTLDETTRWVGEAQ